MQRLNHKTAVLLTAAILTSSILAGGSLTASAIGPGPGGFGGPNQAIETAAELAYSGPVLVVDGEVYGTGNTNGGSCLLNNAIEYQHGVVLSLSQSGLDDSKIDSSHAKVELSAGDGYTVNELKFNATQLVGTWQNGQLKYNLTSEDLMWNNDGYAITAQSGCGRERSCFGGDGITTSI